MAVFRVEKTKDFTVMSNHHLRNVSLSLKAKGLLSLMLSLPDNWDYTTSVADLEIVAPPAGKVFHNADADFPVFYIVHHAGVGRTVKKSAAFIVVDVVPDIG